MSQFLFGGQIQPLQSGLELQEALVIGDSGRIEGVGSISEMESLAGSETKRIDLDGATVLPGLIDTHPHVLHFGARERAVLDITDCRNHQEIVDRIRDEASRRPPGEWIITTPIGEPHYFVRRSYSDLREQETP